MLVLFCTNLLYSQEYCAGDIISQEHQSTVFNQCYPEGCDCEDESQQVPWSLADYNGALNGGDYHIIFLDLSASWCAPCYSSIEYLDELEAYWHERDPSVVFVTALADIGQPYSCDQWGNAGESGSPLIVNDADKQLYNWFSDSNQQYPSFVLIDHEMRVRGKPSGFYSNSNEDICDSGGANSLDGWDGGCINSFIDELLDESHYNENYNEISIDDNTFESEYHSGESNLSAVHFMLGCTDPTACNYNVNANTDDGSCDYSATCTGDDSNSSEIIGFKWYQYDNGGIFRIKVYDDVNGLPGEEIFSDLVPPNNTSGWNQRDLSDDIISVSNNFWVGVEEFSTSPPFGLDINVSQLEVGALWDGDPCTLPEHSLYLNENGTVYYNSPTEISGFQFSLVGVEANTVLGGDAQDAGFILGAIGDNILGYSMTGSTLAGCGTLVELELVQNEFCMDCSNLSETSCSQSAYCDWTYDVVDCADLSEIECYALEGCIWAESGSSTNPEGESDIPSEGDESDDPFCYGNGITNEQCGGLPCDEHVTGLSSIIISDQFAQPLSFINNNNLGVSYQKVGDSWNQIYGNLAFHIIMNCGDDGEDCSYSTCEDFDACNEGDISDCRYPDADYDCCGECAVGVDCAGICGGNTPEDDPECADTEIDCDDCIIVESGESIQDAIDEAVDGQTIIVDKGFYVGNLVIETSITLASRAYFQTDEELASWVAYTGDGYEVTNDNILETIIDGSAGEGSVILINSSSNDCIEVTVFGFTIQGGMGTEVIIGMDVDPGADGDPFSEDDNVETFIYDIYGGGILTNNAIPTINYNYIKECGLCDDRSAACAGAGGALNMGSGIDLGERFGRYSGSRDCADGDLDISNNFYSGNNADYGNTLAATGFEGSLDMTNSIYDVYNCPDQDVSSTWAYIDEEVDADFSGGVGESCSSSSDVWVSPNGNDTNSGTSMSDAFKTINRALEMISVDDNSSITINLTEGTFSPSATGETFPLTMPSNVHLAGQGEGNTTLDAEGETVFNIVTCGSNNLSNISINDCNYNVCGGGNSCESCGDNFSSTNNPISACAENSICSLGGSSNGCAPEIFQGTIQTMFQAFYYFRIDTGDGIETGDWIGVFREPPGPDFGVCSGYRKMLPNFCNGGGCDVPAIGNDFYSPLSDGYMQWGDIPIFILFDISEEHYYTIETELEGLEWVNSYFYMPDVIGLIDNLDICYDYSSCSGGLFGDCEELDECGECGGDGMINGICENFLIGDLNGDGGWNLLDIVILINCVLDENCSQIENGYAGEMNGDGGWNVLDIIALANCILTDTCGE